MCARGDLSHTSQDGRSPWDRLRAGGVAFSAGGENIAAGYRTPAEVHDGWMNSPGHRRNMLGNWTRAAIGIARCGHRMSPFWTEDFIR